MTRGARPIEQVVRLPPSAASPGEARRFVRHFLERAGRTEIEADAGLVVTELVTNAVLHARTEATVTLTLGDVLRIEVGDQGPGSPVVRTPHDVLSTGRGLQLVALVATQWGFDRTDRGKVVWCELGGSQDGDDPGRRRRRARPGGRPAPRRGTGPTGQPTIGPFTLCAAARFGSGGGSHSTTTHARRVA